MKLAVGSDHRGVEAKKRVIAIATTLSHIITDVGTQTTVPVDYPDYAFKAAEAVAAGQVERAILICATGHGMCMAANKVPGIFAVNCRDAVDAEMSRTHNNSNVLCLSADLLSDDTLESIVKIWLTTAFDDPAGRHGRRLEKIAKYESCEY
jgi:ribose 5-phosphate isomerase B